MAFVLTTPNHFVKDSLGSTVSNGMTTSVLAARTSTDPTMSVTVFHISVSIPDINYRVHIWCCHVLLMHPSNSYSFNLNNALTVCYVRYAKLFWYKIEVTG